MSVIKKIILLNLFLILISINQVVSNNINILFNNLQNAKNIKEAEILEKKIWDDWTKHPSSNYLTNKLENATYSMNQQQYQIALKLFTDIIDEDPRWAEAWNKRATLYFLIGKYTESLKDIEQVLNIEPRHFGALSGRAQIYLSFNEYEKAIDDLQNAKAIYPLIKSGKSIELIKKIIKDLQI